MFKLKLQFVVLLPALLFLALLAGSDVLAKERRIVDVDLGVAFPIEKNPSPCAELQVTSVGVVCKSKYGILAHLDFPEVDLKIVLAGDEYLPKASRLSNML